MLAFTYDAPFEGLSQVDKLAAESNDKYALGYVQSGFEGTYFVLEQLNDIIDCPWLPVMASALLNGGLTLFEFGIFFTMVAKLAEYSINPFGYVGSILAVSIFSNAIKNTVETGLLAKQAFFGRGAEGRNEAGASTPAVVENPVAVASLA